MPIRIGDVECKIPLAKAYTGDTEVYEESDPVEPFTVNIVPRSWTSITNYYHYSSTNEYGTWDIEGNRTTASSGGALQNGFNGNTNNFAAGMMSPDETYYTITFPTGVKISPSTLYIVYAYFGDGSEIQGYNVSTNSWEQVTALQYTTSATKSLTLAITTTNYYSAFRIHVYPTSGSVPQLKDFQIKEGNIKG
jgi:hypothetical protein